MGYAAAVAWSEVREVQEVAGAPYGVGARGAGDAAVDPEDAPADPDRLDDLGDEIATLAAHIHAATQRFLALIARFDRLEGWKPGGHKNCSYWLSCRTGYDLGTAREYVRVARSLERLPQTRAAMARGSLSFSQVRALSRVAEPETEADLLELAEGCKVAQLERMVRAWKRVSRMEEAEWERELYRSRTLSVFPDEDGMYVLRARLMPEAGALLMRAIEAAGDALYRQERVPRAATEALANGTGPKRVERDTEREAARRRADALALLAERALAAGFGDAVTADMCGCRGSERPDEEAVRIGKADAEPAREEEGDRTARLEEADTGSERAGLAPRSGSDCGCPSHEAPISGTRAERYLVMLHVDRETLASEEEPGRSELEDGTRISRETSRRLACDGSVVRVEHGPDGSILDVGRKTRTIPPGLRRALEARDRGCRFPGCQLRFTDGHHILHWADGGETNLKNTVLLCGFHHRLVHEGGWRVEWVGRGWRGAAGWVEFIDPRGVVHVGRGWRPPQRTGGHMRRGIRPDGDRGRSGATDNLGRGNPPDRTAGADPVDALLRENRLRGVEPDGRTAGTRWRRESLIPDEVLFRAEEAAP